MKNNDTDNNNKSDSDKKNLNPNDPEFTAKALGEEIDAGTGTSDREVAKEDLAEFESLQAFAETLKDEISNATEHETEQELELEGERIDTLKNHTKKSGGQRKSKLIVFPAWIGGIAAALMIAFLIPKYGRVSEEVMGDATGDGYLPRPTVENRTGEKLELDFADEEIEPQVMAVGMPAPPASAKKLSSGRPDLMVAEMTGAIPPPPEAVFENEFDREGYAHIEENSFQSPMDHPLSTFSIDVDTASYSNARRMLNWSEIPQPDAIRVEEFINYFNYHYAAPEKKAEHPFAVYLDATEAPWNPKHRLLRIALKGKEVDLSERPNANLVFLVDVSGSMNNENKLPLVKKSLLKVIEKMGANDRIAIVVYAGASGLALPSTTANNHETIQHALNRLEAGGSTNGGAGIELAYQVAQKHFIEDGINRVILCTDGDFNVGTTSQGSLQRLIEQQAKESGVFFSAIGFGSGNYQDATMEMLSNKGNGNYAYIDSEREAQKVLSDNMLGTLLTIAKDVKIQVEFNPQQVAAYRLIGYENRMLSKEDFNDDKKDAGEIGVGHTVTALYEVIPVGADEGLELPDVDPLRYQSNQDKSNAVSGSAAGEMLTIKLRYKQPDADQSQLMSQSFIDKGLTFGKADVDLRFAAGVAALAMHMRGSEHLNDYQLSAIEDILSMSKGTDSGGYRSELIELLNTYQTLLEQQKD